MQLYKKTHAYNIYSVIYVVYAIRINIACAKKQSLSVYMCVYMYVCMCVLHVVYAMYVMYVFKMRYACNVCNAM